MYCGICGCPLEDRAERCPACGTAVLLPENEYAFEGEGLSEEEADAPSFALYNHQFKKDSPEHTPGKLIRPVQAAPVPEGHAFPEDPPRQTVPIRKAHGRRKKPGFGTVAAALLCGLLLFTAALSAILLFSARVRLSDAALRRTVDACNFSDLTFPTKRGARTAAELIGASGNPFWDEYGADPEGVAEYMNGRGFKQFLFQSLKLYGSYFRGEATLNPPLSQADFRTFLTNNSRLIYETAGLRFCLPEGDGIGTVPDEAALSAFCELLPVDVLDEDTLQTLTGIPCRLLPFPLSVKGPAAACALAAVLIALIFFCCGYSRLSFRLSGFFLRTAGITAMIAGALGWAAFTFADAGILKLAFRPITTLLLLFGTGAFLLGLLIGLPGRKRKPAPPAENASAPNGPSPV